MTLKIEITQDEYRKIELSQIDITKLVKSVIASLPEPAGETNGLSDLQEANEEAMARASYIRGIRGSFAYLTSPGNYASDELHRQRQLDKEREKALGLEEVIFIR